VHLKEAIDNYTRALSTFHTGVSIKVLEVLNSMPKQLLRFTNSSLGIAALIQPQIKDDKPHSSEEKFIVP